VFFAFYALLADEDTLYFTSMMIKYENLFYGAAE